MEKKYIVRLTKDERATLKQMISSGKCPARTQMRARVLLKADQSKGKDWETDVEIAKAVSVASTTVENIRKRFVERGFPECLETPGRPDVTERRIIGDGALEAKLVAIACSSPPEGRAKWTLRLLADRMVELEYVDTVGREAIRLALKKMNLSLG